MWRKSKLREDRRKGVGARQSRQSVRGLLDLESRAMISTEAMPQPVAEDQAAYRAQQFAMLLSVAIGVGMLVLKSVAYALTGSAAVLSDVAESVVHVGAVAFAAYSVHVSYHPADRDHPYGHERIGFFSAGVEGGLIGAAALFILYESVPRLFAEQPVEALDVGTALVFAAGAINGLLGWYLIRIGKKQDSLILVADGKHVLTDTWTSLGVAIGLLLVMATGWTILDPILAVVVALNILFSGYGLVRQSTEGLMDQVDPEKDAAIRRVLKQAEITSTCRFHALRQRDTGRTYWIEMHLLFPGNESLTDVHHAATTLEQKLKDAVGGEVVVTTHLEPLERHEQEHTRAE